LAEALDATTIEVLSLEDAHANNDLAQLLPRFASTTIALGVIGVARSRIETVPEIAARLEAALVHLPPDRLMAAPDCGLGYLPRELALAKLRNLAEAAHAFS